MAEFTVITLDTMTHVQEIEAETWQEAQVKAEEEGVPGLCHQCSSHWSRDEQNVVISVGIGNAVSARAHVGEIGPLVEGAED